MREPDCVLVRVGEAALKSAQVQARWFRILQANMRAALSAAGIEAELETNPNRVFVYTSQCAEAMRALSKVFGITSASPAWVTASRLDEIGGLAADLAKEVLKLDGRRSFAIRAHRAGRHPFTSKEVAEAAGAAVKRVTGARVNLEEPDREIEVEVRSRRSYLMLERTEGPGGLPLGSGGRALAVLSGWEDALAAWLVARRGVELVVLADARGQAFVDWLKSWHIGREMKVFQTKWCGAFQQVVEGEGLKAAVLGEGLAEGVDPELRKAGLLVLRPLVGMSEREQEELAGRINLPKE